MSIGHKESIFEIYVHLAVTNVHKNLIIVSHYARFKEPGSNQETFDSHIINKYPHQSNLVQNGTRMDNTVALQLEDIDDSTTQNFETVGDANSPILATIEITNLDTAPFQTAANLLITVSDYKV